MIHHTENETTTQLGQSIATVICDSINAQGNRIVTMELVYPRYIHSELMTHRAFSRNASSSRATPCKVLAQEVIDDPVFFDYVGLNQSGMVAGEELDAESVEAFRKEWAWLGAYVAKRVLYWSEVKGIHKQTINRALEPWSRIRTLVTATEWGNFFKLRLAEDVQPEIRSLAMAILQAQSKSFPKERLCHMPYVTDEELSTEVRENWSDISAARCARVSYARLDGKPTTIESDLALAKRLLDSGHMSPFEHVAVADDEKWANFDGWRSYRNYLGK